MKHYISMVLFAITLSTLTACSPAISGEDRAFIAEARSGAEKAKNDAVVAARDAQEASEKAVAAASAATSASQKIDKTYQTSQNK